MGGRSHQRYGTDVHNLPSLFDQISIAFSTAKKEVAGELYYQVKFKGWPKLYWEPEENVNGCQDLIYLFEQEEEVKEKLKDDRKKEEAEGNYEVKKILEVKIKKVRRIRKLRINYKFVYEY